MYSHITLGSNDLSKAEPLYDALMAVLGHPVLMKTPAALGYGEPSGQHLFIVPPFDRKEAHPGNGVHAAFSADTRAKVDAFYKAAMDNGGSDAGPPGLRPHYHPNYYGAYVRNPDGNKIQAVCHRKEG